MGIVLSKNANESVTATMATNYEISGAAEAANNTAVADAPIIEAEDWQTEAEDCLRQKQIYIQQRVTKRCKICCSSVKRQEAGDSSSQVYSCNQQSCVLCHVLRPNGGN